MSKEEKKEEPQVEKDKKILKEKSLKKPLKKVNKVAINRNLLVALATGIAVFAVAIISILIAFNASKDFGMSIPDNFSRHISENYMIGYPGGWTEVNANAVQFGATGNDIITGDKGGSMSVSLVDMSELLQEYFVGHDEAGCDQVRDYLDNNRDPNLEYVSLASSNYKINGQDLCQVDIKTKDQNDEVTVFRILITSTGLENESYLITADWVEGSDYEEDVKRSLRTFKIINLKSYEDIIDETSQNQESIEFDQEDLDAQLEQLESDIQEETEQIAE